MAFDGRYDSEAAKPPVSLHPAFPAIVALWFSALLGVGSLVLPAVLLERAVLVTGVASFVPAAAPPLGFTARSIIALVAALVGAGVGIAVARRVANSHRPKPQPRFSKLVSGSRKPLSVKEELGGEGVTNGQGLPISRRRALAISEDDRPSDFLYQAPLPGHAGDEPAPFSAAALPEAGDAADKGADEPLELSELAAEDPYADAAPRRGQPDPDEDPEMTDRQEFQPVTPFQQFGAPEPELDEPVEELDTRKNLAGPRGLEPLPFSPPSLARRAPEPEPEPEFEPEFEPEPEPQARFEPVAVAAPEVAEPEFRADWETAPLDGLGLVQLVQRLGSTIERRRELMVRTAAPAAGAPFAAAPADFEPAPAEEAALAMAAFFAPNSPAEADEPAPAAEHAEEAGPAPVEDEEPEAPAMPRPNFLSSFSAEDDDEGDEALPDFSLPLRRSPAQPVSFANEDDSSEDEVEEKVDEGEDSYSSLLGMKNPFAAPKTEFVRIEEPEEDEAPAEPAVVFPGQQDPAEPAPVYASRLFDPPGKGATPAAAPQPPADADAALRAALATLQRMSGAA